MDQSPAARARWRATLAELAEDTDGVVTTAALRAIGVPPSTISGRLRPHGRWTRVLPGVVLTTGGRPDADQRDRAAVLYAGDDALLGGLSALRRFGLRSAARLESAGGPPPVHVLVGHDRHVASVGFVMITRTRRLPERAPGQPIPSSPAVRALADVIRGGLHSRTALQALVDECLHRGLVDASALEEEAGAGPRQGSARVREAAVRARDREPATMREALAAVIERAGLSRARWQPVLTGAAGELVGRPLAWLDDPGIAIEPIGADDLAAARLQAYGSRGIAVLPVSARLLRTDPAGQAQALRALADRTAERWRPPVRVDAGPATASHEPTARGRV